MDFIPVHTPFALRSTPIATHTPNTPEGVNTPDGASTLWRATRAPFKETKEAGL